MQVFEQDGIRIGQRVFYRELFDNKKDWRLADVIAIYPRSVDEKDDKYPPVALAAFLPGRHGIIHSVARARHGFEVGRYALAKEAEAHEKNAEALAEAIKQKTDEETAKEIARQAGHVETKEPPKETTV